MKTSLAVLAVVALFGASCSNSAREAQRQQEAQRQAHQSGLSALRKKAQRPGLSALRKKAYQQIALLAVSHSAGPPGERELDVNTLKAGSESPALTLARMGLPVLPVLAEALDDATSTQIPLDYMDRSAKGKAWQINELVARVIVQTAQHRFLVNDWDQEGGLRPDQMPSFRRAVLAWHARNRNRTLTERKIADVGDSIYQNRMSALEWLGEHKTRKAKPAIVQRINHLLASKVRNYVQETELTESAYTLGQIGDKTCLPIVRRVCRYLAKGVKVENGSTYSLNLDSIWPAYEGRALLGEKAQSLRELRGIHAPYLWQLDGGERSRYEGRMEDAAKW